MQRYVKTQQELKNAYGWLNTLSIIWINYKTTDNWTMEQHREFLTRTIDSTRTLLEIVSDHIRLGHEVYREGPYHLRVDDVRDSLKLLNNMLKFVQQQAPCPILPNKQISLF